MLIICNHVSYVHVCMITLRRLLKSSASESSFPHFPSLENKKANHLLLYRSTEYAMIVLESENL